MILNNSQEAKTASDEDVESSKRFQTKELADLGEEEKDSELEQEDKERYLAEESVLQKEESSTAQEKALLEHPEDQKQSSGEPKNSSESGSVEKDTHVNQEISLSDEETARLNGEANSLQQPSQKGTGRAQSKERSKDAKVNPIRKFFSKIFPTSSVSEKVIAEEDGNAKPSSIKDSETAKTFLPNNSQGAKAASDEDAESSKRFQTKELADLGEEEKDSEIEKEDKERYLAEESVLQKEESSTAQERSILDHQENQKQPLDDPQSPFEDAPVEKVKHFLQDIGLTDEKALKLYEGANCGETRSHQKAKDENSQSQDKENPKINPIRKFFAGLFSRKQVKIDKSDRGLHSSDHPKSSSEEAFREKLNEVNEDISMELVLEPEPAIPF